MHYDNLFPKPRISNEELDEALLCFIPASMAEMLFGGKEDFVEITEYPPGAIFSAYELGYIKGFRVMVMRDLVFDCNGDYWKHSHALLEETSEES